jgi:glutamyl-tRNA synthetase
MRRHELVERFSLERVGPSPATLDVQKLDWLNGVYLRDLQPDEYALQLCHWLDEQSNDWPRDVVRATAPLVQEKIERFDQYPGFVRFFFEPVSPDGADPATCAAAAERLAVVEPWSAPAIEDALRSFADDRGEKPRVAFQPIRLAVTGSKVSPGLFESLELLGRDETLRRLGAAAQGL